MNTSPYVLILLAALGLQGCKPKTPVPMDENSVTIDHCSGSAPSGELVAERIIGANSTRNEPGLYEGPIWLNGALYFSDFTFSKGFPSRIQRLDTDGVMTTVFENSGSNGLAIDTQGNIVGSTHSYKSVSRFNLATGERISIAEKYNNNVFNSPNDLTVAADGTIYFTDPSFQRDAAPGGQRKTSVYRVATDGTITVVDDSIDNPNGIALSRAGNVLYVNGGGEKGLLRAYPIVNGVPQDGTDLVKDLSVPDGMAVDCHGNLYVTEHIAHKVRVFTPAGKQIATIKVDANVTNAAFGGAEGKTLYLTGAGSVWKLDLDVTGSAY